MMVLSMSQKPLQNDLKEVYAILGILFSRKKEHLGKLELFLKKPVSQNTYSHQIR